MNLFHNIKNSIFLVKIQIRFWAVLPRPLRAVNRRAPVTCIFISLTLLIHNKNVYFKIDTIERRVIFGYVIGANIALSTTL